MITTVPRFYKFIRVRKGSPYRTGEAEQVITCFINENSGQQITKLMLIKFIEILDMSLYDEVVKLLKILKRTK